MDVLPKTEITIYDSDEQIDIDYEPLKYECMPKDEPMDDYCSVSSLEDSRAYLEGVAELTDMEMRGEFDPVDLPAPCSDDELTIEDAHRVFRLGLNRSDLYNRTQTSPLGYVVKNNRIRLLKQSTPKLQKENSSHRLADSLFRMNDLIKKHITQRKKLEVVKIGRLFDCERYFVCDTCFVPYKTSELLTEHVKCHGKIPVEFIEDKSQIICGTCQFNCPNVNDCKKYKNVDNEIESYACAPPGVITAVENGSVCFKCNFCLYICKFILAYKKHVSEHFSTELIQCKDCTFECVNDNVMQNHRKVNHNVVVCVKLSCCDLCELKFITKDELDVHRVSDHNIKVYRCKECSLKFETRSELIKHKLFAHNHNNRVDLFICDLCELEFAYKKDLNAHKLDTHNVEKPYKCGRCSYQCKDENLLKRHQNLTSHGNEYKCENCAYQCKFQNELKRHSSEMHGTDKIFSCGFCDYKTDNTFRLKSHKTVHGDVKPHRCDVCDYRCKVKAHLRRHKMSHTDVRPFKCDTCPKTYRNRYDLKRHIMTHTREHPYRCSVCPFKATTAEPLRRHQMTHTGETPLSCDLCAYKGRFPTCLKRHMANKHDIGTKRKLPFTCVLCSYRCEALCILKNHILKHTGEKPLACDQCPFKTRRANNLKIHKMMHTGEKPVECELCDYKSRYRANMVKHMLVHSGVAKYECEVCHKKFKRSDYFKKHLSTHC